MPLEQIKNEINKEMDTMKNDMEKKTGIDKKEEVNYLSVKNLDSENYQMILGLEKQVTALQEKLFSNRDLFLDKTGKVLDPEFLKIYDEIKDFKNTIASIKQIRKEVNKNMENAKLKANLEAKNGNTAANNFFKGIGYDGKVIFKDGYSIPTDRETFVKLINTNDDYKKAIYQYIVQTYEIKDSGEFHPITLDETEKATNFSKNFYVGTVGYNVADVFDNLKAYDATIRQANVAQDPNISTADKNIVRTANQNTQYGDIVSIDKLENEEQQALNRLDTIRNSFINQDLLPYDSNTSDIYNTDFVKGLRLTLKENVEIKDQKDLRGFQMIRAVAQCDNNTLINLMEAIGKIRYDESGKVKEEYASSNSNTLISTDAKFKNFPALSTKKYTGVSRENSQAIIDKINTLYPYAQTSYDDINETIDMRITVESIGRRYQQEKSSRSNNLITSGIFMNSMGSTKPGMSGLNFLNSPNETPKLKETKEIIANCLDQNMVPPGITASITGYNLDVLNAFNGRNIALSNEANGNKNTPPKYQLEYSLDGNPKPYSSLTALDNELIGIIGRATQSGYNGKLYRITTNTTYNGETQYYLQTYRAAVIDQNGNSVIKRIAYTDKESNKELYKEDINDRRRYFNGPLTPGS